MTTTQCAKDLIDDRLAIEYMELLRARENRLFALDIIDHIIARLRGKDRSDAQGQSHQP